MNVDFQLSPEVDSAHWVSLEEAPARMFPDRPGNTQHILYRQYLTVIQPKRQCRQIFPRVGTYDRNLRK